MTRHDLLGAISPPLTARPSQRGHVSVEVSLVHNHLTSIDWTGVLPQSNHAHGEVYGDYSAMSYLPGIGLISSSSLAESSTLSS